MERLTELLRRLHSAGVEFVLVGGLAAVRHGTCYVTYDVDICIPIERENVRKIENAIGDLHPRFSQRPDLPFEVTDEMIAGLKNLYLLTDYGRLDCLGEVKAIGDYAATLRHSVLARFPFGDVRVLELDALIRAKEAIGRPQDLFVTAQLRAIQERLEERKKK
jgi:hypothetical protein